MLVNLGVEHLYGLLCYVRGNPRAALPAFFAVNFVTGLIAPSAKRCVAQH